MACRTACLTQDHDSLGECMRAAHLHIGQVDISVQRRWDAELNAYRDARLQGAQPASTRLADTRFALDASDMLGRPYDAAKGPIQ